jgi:hypothetical protein
LLEILVALAVLGLLLSAAVAMLRFSLVLVGRQVARTEAGADAAPVRDYLEALIDDARPGLFDGASQRLTLVASAGQLGLQTIRLSLVGTGMQITWRPPGAPADSAVSSQILLAPLTGLRFRYFGRQPAGAAAEWHSQWHGMPTLPLLVGLAWTRPGRAPETELVVAPRVSEVARQTER